MVRFIRDGPRVCKRSMAETTGTTSEPTPGMVVVVEQEMGGETTTRHDKQTDVVRTTPTWLEEKEKVTGEGSIVVQGQRLELSSTEALV